MGDQLLREGSLFAMVHVVVSPIGFSRRVHRYCRVAPVSRRTVETAGSDSASD